MTNDTQTIADLFKAIWARPRIAFRPEELKPEKAAKLDIEKAAKVIPDEMKKATANVIKAIHEHGARGADGRLIKKLR